MAGGSPMYQYKKKKKKKKKKFEALLNSLPSKPSLGILVFVHFEVPLDRKCSRYRSSGESLIHPIPNFDKHFFFFVLQFMHLPSKG